MSFLSRHPSDDALADFGADSSPLRDASRGRVARHLASCEECRSRLRWIRQLSGELATAPLPTLAPELKARVLASRAAGVRTILPVTGAGAARPGGRAPARWLAAAASILLVAAIGLLLGDTTEIEAGATAGTLTFAPAMPRAGETVRVTYRAPVQLANESRLVLRARIRTERDRSYNDGIPVRALGTLARSADGTYTTSVELPADVVYAALVVEDPSAARVDDNDGRLWELLVSADGTKPLFEALDQRAEDLMGRNWEEGHATVRRMIALYPDEQRAWTWLRAFHTWLGVAEDDSIRALHRDRLAALDARWRGAADVPVELIGRIYWYARADDSTTSAHWRARLLREAPTTSFAIQERIRDAMSALAVSHDTAGTLAALDGLWHEAPHDRTEQVAGTAFDIVRASTDTAGIRRWSDRLVQAARDPIARERAMAQQYSMIPTLRAEGMARIRSSIARLDSLPPDARALGETEARQSDRIAVIGRRLQASLGRALVADGRNEEGLAVLTAAAAEGWDLQVLRSARTASLAAGDTAGALAFAARIAADPRTDSAATRADADLASRAIGAATWQRALDTARGEFAERMLEGADVRAMRGRARVRDMSGATHDLRALADGRVTVVAIWSRACGPAVDALPRLGEVADRLAAAGVRVVGVVDERAPSAELTAFLQERKVTMPTYVDAFGEVATAFNAWGTPTLYVLDPEGRIRFPATSDPYELLARAEAVRLATVAN